MVVNVPCIPRMLHPDVIPSVLNSGYTVAVVDVTPPSSYFHSFVRWWDTQPEGFLIVEHDVEILPAAVTETVENILQEMEYCDSPWCVSPYNDIHLLGCSKFIPKRLEIDWRLVRKLSGGDWLGLDMAISSSLRKMGEIPHVHRRATLHHHGQQKLWA